MEKEYVFSDLAELAAERDNVSEVYQENKWRIAEYQTGVYGGKMLVTPERVFPDKVTFNVNLTGVYRIYVGVPSLRSENYLYIKLSDDLCYTGLRPAPHWRRPKHWGTEEYFEEVYWKTADLTDRNIIINKPNSMFNSATGIAWIRCVPADENELKETINNKCLQMHVDEEHLAEDSQWCDDDYLMKVYQCANKNADFVSFEFAFDYDKVADCKTPRLHQEDGRRDSGAYDFADKKERIYKKTVDFAHANDLKLYAANRMSVCNFCMPYTRYGWNFNFPDDNPQYYCRNRDMSVVKVCSYAYDEVQDFVIKQFVDVLKHGFDGVTLIYHRGLHIGFEEPVIKRFKELYPDVDPCLLPYSDERLYGVLCGFMNEFMHKLRKTLDSTYDRHIAINVITDFSLATSKYLGLDAEYWAKNGLIDSIAQADMETFEDLEGCMSDTEQGLIDMEKYRQVIKQRPVILRNYGTDVDKVVRHIPEYMELKKQYGVEVYNVIPWVHHKLPEEYDGIIEKMQDAGAEKFLSWNTNHLVWDLPEWYVVSRIGNKRDDTIEHRRFYRTLSIDGNDISHFSPNWRG